LVGEQSILRESRRQREECHVHLMRVEVDAGRRLSQRVLAQPFEGDAMRKVRALVRWAVNPI
jgi:hypothetical protein